MQHITCAGNIIIQFVDTCHF